MRETSLKLYGEFKKDGKVVGYFENYYKNILTNGENLYEFPVRTFEKFQIAGKSSVFNPGSSLKIPLKYRLDGKLVIDFWVKHLSFGHSYFKLLNDQNNNIEFSLDLNEY